MPSEHNIAAADLMMELHPNCHCLNSLRLLGRHDVSQRRINARNPASTFTRVQSDSRLRGVPVQRFGLSPRGVQELAGASRHCRSDCNAAILQSSPAAWPSTGCMAGGCVHQCRGSPCARAPHPLGDKCSIATSVSAARTAAISTHRYRDCR